MNSLTSNILNRNAIATMGYIIYLHVLMGMPVMIYIIYLAQHAIMLTIGRLVVEHKCQKTRSGDL